MSLTKIHEQDDNAGKQTIIETRKFAATYAKNEDGEMETILSDEYEVVGKPEPLVLENTEHIQKKAIELSQSNSRVQRFAAKMQSPFVTLKFLT